MSVYKWLLDAGHGGILNGRYATAPSKQFKFADGLEVYEGLINRQIASKLIALLNSAEIDYGLVYDEHLDTSLAERVAIADKVFAKHPNALYLSIHSNAGGGKGFEVFTSPGQTKSDKIATVFCSKYMENFKNKFPLRSELSDGDADKEADFYVLRKTDCPALLVENLFFDNREEAEFLISEIGQMAIAQCLFESIQLCETTKPI